MASGGSEPSAVGLVEPVLVSVDEVVIGAGAELQAAKPPVGHREGVGGIGQVAPLC